jgi:hypothetical protein
MEVNIQNTHTFIGNKMNVQLNLFLESQGEYVYWEHLRNIYYFFYGRRNNEKISM